MLQTGLIPVTNRRASHTMQSSDHAATVKQLNRQLAQDIELLDREIERNSPHQLPARHRYAAGAPVYRQR